MGLCGYSVWLMLMCLLRISAKEACLNQLYISSLDDRKIQTKTPSFKDCSEISFEGNEKLNSHLGNLKLAVLVQDKNAYALNISFLDIKWKKAYLKLSEESKPETAICKVYSSDNQKSPILEVVDECLNLNSYNSSANYVLDFKAVLNTDTLYKRLLFNLPSPETFGNSIFLAKRAIFVSIDTSSNYGIVLKIQPLPRAYNVTFYKVEVFKEKGGNEALLDVRMLSAEAKDQLSFEYITYNEEGYYFFKVSAINDACPEDYCLKSVSPKIYIRRKYPPLVIGIVGASFLIPFVLFIFHMWTRRTQLKDENEERKDAVFFVNNETPEKHYLIVKALEKSLKSLANVQVVPKISDASYIVYICGTHIFEPDPTTHKLLVIEANKAISNVEILVVSFPYSTKEVPPYLKKCVRFELMEDFGKFIQTFNCDAEFENNSHYIDLSCKVQAAQIHTEPKKIILNMPIIIVTEQSDSESEPREGDDLL